MLQGSPSPEVLVASLTAVLIAGAVVLGVMFLARTVAGWGKDSPVPGSAPAWIGHDLVEAADCVQILIDRIRQEHGLEPLERHPAIEEMALQHAHDMAVREFFGPIDPDGVDLDARLVRLHPTMVVSLSQWQGEGRTVHAADASELASSLLSGSIGEGKALQDLARVESLNAMGIGVAGSAQRATVCIVFAHHWATLLRDRPSTDREGTWAVAAALVPGTKVEQLSAALLPDGVTPMGQVPAEPFSHDGWEETWVCVYVKAVDNLDAARVQWYRGSVQAVALPLP
jgi:hypothetical protein